LLLLLLLLRLPRPRLWLMLLLLLLMRLSYTAEPWMRLSSLLTLKKRIIADSRFASE
jgi:hypothetical protein